MFKALRIPQHVTARPPCVRGHLHPCRLLCLASLPCHGPPWLSPLPPLQQAWLLLVADGRVQTPAGTPLAWARLLLQALLLRPPWLLGYVQTSCLEVLEVVEPVEVQAQAERAAAKDPLLRPPCPWGLAKTACWTFDCRA